MAVFRLCSTRQSRSQAGLCHCTRRLISDQPEPTIARLRYYLGGDRPSQTAQPYSVPDPDDGPRLDNHINKGGISHFGSTRASAHASKPTTYSTHADTIASVKLAVKVHGVFPSDRRNPASSRGIQFH